MLVDLVRTTTRDDVRLDGVYQAPASDGPTVADLGVDAFVLVHGTGSNFYGATLFDPIADHLLTRGIGVLRVNTRGHDLMSTAATSRGGRRLGAAYEVVDDCRADLAAWIAWLCGIGIRRIGLLGHSLGAVKCLYALAAEPNPAVTRLVAVSPPRLSYRWFAASERAAEFHDLFDRAQALVAAGEPHALLDVTLPLPFAVTAAGYVEKYGPDERYNFLRYIARITCPTLVTFGAIEISNNMAFRDSVAAIAEVRHPGITVATIADADHFYSGVRPALIEQLGVWLTDRAR